MNYSYFFGLFSLMCFVFQARAWFWTRTGQKDLIEALRWRTLPFMGYDVEEMKREEILRICNDVTTKSIEPPIFSNENVMIHCVEEMKVKVEPADSDTIPMKVFKCGSDSDKFFFLGQGPYRYQIAVYIRYNLCPNLEPYGIIEYNSPTSTSQLPRSATFS